MYLPDTNILIRAIQGYDIGLHFLEYIIMQNALNISVIVIGEFYAKASDQDKIIFNKLLSQFPVLGIDEKIATIAGEYREQLLRSSRTHLLDCFLAAQAKVHNLTLVTNNKADFPMRDIKVISEF